VSKGRLSKSQIKQKYDNYFDMLNEAAKALNLAGDDDDDDDFHRPLFRLKPEEERITEPTIEDLKDIMEEYDNIKNIRNQ
jgi:hypothetical protein